MQDTTHLQSPVERLTTLLDRLECAPKDLARQTELSLDTIRAALAVDGAPTLRTRCAIEAALGLAIWSAPEDYQRRKQAAESIGFSAETATLKQLRRRAQELGIKGYGEATNKSALAALILRELAARKAREEELQSRVETEL